MVPQAMFHSKVAYKWFKAAHEGTYNLFLTVTDKEVQEKEWKPR